MSDLAAPNDPPLTRPATQPFESLSRLAGQIPNIGAGGQGITMSIRVPLEDLTEDKLLQAAPRGMADNQPVPMLGKIPLLARLGQGGMSAVYYGLHPRLRIEVAVKVLPFSLAEKDPVLIERFFREAQTAARVRSPHLVHVSDVNEENGIFYIVMEYVLGVSAAQYLKAALSAGQKGVLATEALEICIAATTGLGAAHEEGIVHRDVKPANIMLPRRRDGTGYDLKAGKLADLGLARTEEHGGKQLTTTFAVMGTPGYMAPEQVQDSGSAGKPADVFGMGATLYALLRGHSPFLGATPMDTLNNTVTAQHEPISKFRPEVPLAFDPLIDRCLAKEPAKRFPDAQALLDAMLECLPKPPMPASAAAKAGNRHPDLGKTVVLAKPAAEERVAPPRSVRMPAILPVLKAQQPAGDGATPGAGSPTRGAELDSTVASAREKTAAAAPRAAPLDLKFEFYRAWPCDEREAIRRQSETARAMGVPESMSLLLPNQTPLELMLLPAGEFAMGSSHTEEGREKDEQLHYARITRPFYIGACEVTQAQWLAVSGSNPSKFKDAQDSPQRPVERVSWLDIQKNFLEKIQPLAPSGWHLRLPTEAEWEYACRAGTETPYYFGSSMETYQGAFMVDQSKPRRLTMTYRKTLTYRRKTDSIAKSPAHSSGATETMPTGSYAPNAWGLFDMHGNVWEWCEDWYDEKFYQKDPAVDPANLERGEFRVLRGGSWNYSARSCRSAQRYRRAPEDRHFNFGFRIVLAPAR